MDADPGTRWNVDASALIASLDLLGEELRLKRHLIARDAEGAALELDEELGQEVEVLRGLAERAGRRLPLDDEASALEAFRALRAARARFAELELVFHRTVLVVRNATPPTRRILEDLRAELHGARLEADVAMGEDVRLPENDAVALRRLAQETMVELLARLSPFAPLGALL